MVLNSTEGRNAIPPKDMASPGVSVVVMTCQPKISQSLKSSLISYLIGVTYQCSPECDIISGGWLRLQ